MTGVDPLAVVLAAVDGNEGCAPELIESLYGAHAAEAREYIAAEIEKSREEFIRLTPGDYFQGEAAYDVAAYVARGGI